MNLVHADDKFIEVRQHPKACLAEIGKLLAKGDKAWAFGVNQGAVQLYTQANSFVDLVLGERQQGLQKVEAPICDRHLRAMILDRVTDDFATRRIKRLSGINLAGDTESHGTANKAFEVSFDF